MLNMTTKITIEGKCSVDNKEIKGFRGIIDTNDNFRVKFYHFDIDEEACEEHRKIVREDQAEFEDYVYQVKEKAKKIS